VQNFDALGVNFTTAKQVAEKILISEANVTRLEQPEASVETLLQQHLPFQNVTSNLGTEIRGKNTKTKDEPKFAIFFNTFSSNNTKHAENIIKSQLNSINSQPLLDGSPLFYTRVGNFSWEWPLSICQNSSLGRNATRICQQIIAVHEGDEMLSLDPLHRYCQAPAHKKHKVVYMHSKGTFTANKHNDQLRSILMRAILSKECLIDLSSEAELSNKRVCDVCSTKFNFVPQLHYVGNMWVAQCSYISKLIPPLNFESRKQQVIDNMVNYTRQIDEKWFETKFNNATSYRFKSSSYQWIQRPSWTGVGRFAAEQWIGSHPGIQPCEVFQSDLNPSIQYGKNINLNRFQPPKLVRLNETNTTPFGGFYHPWYGVKGRLFQYEELYSQAPPRNSWFYRYFTI